MKKYLSAALCVMFTVFLFADSKADPPAGQYFEFWDSYQSQAWNFGYNEGMKTGKMEGTRDGMRDGQNEGRTEGDKKGKEVGYNEGFASGKLSGEKEGKENGAREGKYDGNSKGEREGTIAGEKRCYDEGYNTGSGEGYAKGAAEAEKTDNYNRGLAKGTEDGKKEVPEKGQKAGYQAGFAEKEKSLRDSFWNENSRSAESPQSKLITAVSEASDKKLSELRVALTKDDSYDYRQGFESGKNNSYRTAYDKAKQMGFNETYLQAYNSSYQFHYQNGLRDGFASGKDEGFKIAYQQNFDRYYSESYSFYKNRDYPGSRESGRQSGLSAGYKSGYEETCSSLYSKGYNKGYADVSAQLYQPAFDKGKKQGIAACDEHYRKNFVLDVYAINVSDDNNDGVFMIGETVNLALAIANYGFVSSADLTLKFSSSNTALVLNADSHSCGVISGRKNVKFSQQSGKIADDVILGKTAIITVSVVSQNSVLSSQTVKFSVTNPTQKKGTSTDNWYTKPAIDKDYDKTWSLQKNETVTVLEYKKGWLKIFVPRKDCICFVLPKCLKTEFVIPPQMATIKVSNTVNMRKGPGTDYAVVGSLKNGARVTILGQEYSDSWYQDELWYNVKTSAGKTGWVFSQYVVLDD